MFTILGHLAGALGLFFMGARFLTEQLKTLTNRRLRLSAIRWTNNPCMGFVWGLIAGSVMQSMTILTFVVVSLLKSDLVSPKRAYPILLGCNVGGALLVLIVMLDVKLIALYILGLSQIVTLVIARDQASRYRAMATACFGLALIILGSIMLRESVVPLATYPWFQEAVEWMGDSLILPLLIGALLTLLAQSTGPVIMISIGMATAGLLATEQVLILYCGACLGSSLGLYLLTMTITGRARQVAMYQVLYNVVLNAIFVPPIVVEAYLDVPLVAAAVHASGLPLAQSLAMFIIFSEAATAAFQLATLHFGVRWIERWWPPTEVEALAKPLFIHDLALDDVEAALRLVDLEQRRLLEMLSRYLDTVRSGTELSELREAAKAVLGRLEEFLGDLAERCLNEKMADKHGSMIVRQKLFTRLEEQVVELCEVLRDLPPQRSLDNWSPALVEGIDVVFLVLIDTLESDDAAAWPLTTQLARERGEDLHRLRDMSLKDEPTLAPDERKRVLKLASIIEHIFLLLSLLVHKYRQASRIDEAFLDHADLEEPITASTAHTDVHYAARERFAFANGEVSESAGKL